MREYAKIESKFWIWAARHRLTDDAKLLALYFLSNTHSNSIGVYHLPLAYIVADLGWLPERIRETVSELSEKPFRNGLPNPFILYCKSTSYVYITDYLVHNPPANNNIAKNMAGAISQIPAEFSYWPEFKDVLKRFAKRFPNGLLNGLPNGFETNNNNNRNNNKDSTPLLFPPDETDAKPKPKAKGKRAKPRTKFKGPVPDGWKAEAMADPDFAGLSIEREAKKFENYWAGEGGVKADWKATWRNWCHNAVEYQRKRGNGDTPSQRFDPAKAEADLERNRR